MWFFQLDAEKSAPFLIKSYFREQVLLLLWPGSGWACRLGRWGWSPSSIIYSYDLGQVTKPV